MYISLMVGRHFNQFMLGVYHDNLDYCVKMTLKMINNAHREITLGLTVAREPRLDIYWQTKIKVEFWYFLTSTRSDSSCMTGIFWRWPLISLKKLVSKWLEKPCMNFNVKYQELLEGFNPQFFLCTLRTFSPTWEMIQKLPKSPGYTVLAKSKFGTSPMGKVFSLES